MSKKLLSLTLALALLLGALSCGFVLAGSEPAAPEATDKGDYTVQTVADKDTSYADWLTEITAQSNLLAGLRPVTYDSADFISGTIGVDSDGKYHQYCPGANASYLHDGFVPGINADIDNGTTTNKKIFWETSKYPYLYIDLGDVVTIDQLLLAAAVGEGSFGTVTIYAGDDKNDLVNDANLVARETGFFSAVITPDTTIYARYLAIHFTGSMARVSELGIYTFTPIATDRGDYTVDMVNSPAFGAYAAEVLAGNNILKNVTPKTYASADFVNGTAGGFHVNSNKGSYLVDGNIPGITDDTTSDGYKVFWDCNASPYLFYDLGGSATIEKLLIAGSYPEYKGYGTKMGNFKVYAGNDPATLVSDDNLIADETPDVAAVISFKAPVSAKYIAIRFGGQGGYARVSELAVYSSAPIVVPPIVTDKGDYVETVVTVPGQAHALAESLARLNLALGLTPAIYADTDFVNGTAGNVSVDYGYSVSSLTDSIIPGITNDSTNANNKVFWNSTNSPYLFYDLNGKAAIDEILLAGSYPEYKGYGTKLGSVKIYAGNDPATLVSDDNLIAEGSIDVVALFTFDTGIKARYVAIWFGGHAGYARVSELGIYGTAPEGIERDNYIVNTYTDTNGTEKLFEVLNKTNIIDCFSGAVYNNTSFTGNPGSTNNNGSMTNGKIPGITAPVTEDEMDPNKSGVYKGHWNSSNYPYLYYDLGGKATVENILLAGSVPEGMALGQVRVYMSNSLDTLFHAGSLVADEQVGFASLLTFKEPVECQYIVVHFLASYARVSELGFYSSTGYAKPKAPNGADISVTVVNSPENVDKLDPFLSQSNWLDLAAAYSGTLHNEVPLKESMTVPSVEGGNVSAIADNVIPGLCNDEDSSKQKIYWSCNDNQYLLFDMGMECREIRSVLISGSYTEYIGWGSALGKMRLYIGNDMSTLISEENCYAELNVTVCSVVTLPETIDARYIAFWFEGVGGYARVSDVGIYCDYIPAISQMPERFTADTKLGEITLKIKPTMADLYNGEQLASIKGVRLTEKNMPADMPESIDSGRLSPKGDKIYSLELYNANGETVALEQEHMILVTMPNIDREANTMSIYKDGEWIRPWNIIPTVDRKTMLVGTDFGNEGTIYYKDAIDFVFLRFNTPDEVRELTKKPKFNNFSLSYSNGDPVVQY